MEINRSGFEARATLTAVKSASAAPAAAPSDDVELMVSQRSLVMDMQDDMAAALSQFRRRLTQQTRETRRNLSESAKEAEKAKQEGNAEPIEKLAAISADVGYDPRRFLAAALRLYRDPAELAAMLAALFRSDEPELEDKTDAKRAAAQAYALLLAGEKGAAIRAGMNANAAARSFSERLRLRAKELRRAYSDFLFSDADTLEIYERLLEEFGLLVRHEVLGFLEAALLADMGATDPSCSIAEFGNRLSQLGQLRLLRCADVAFSGALKRAGVLLDLPDDSPALTKFFVRAIRFPALGKELYDTLLASCLCLSLPGQPTAAAQSVVAGASAIPARVFHHDPEQANAAKQLLLEALAQNLPADTFPLASTQLGRHQR